MKRNPRKYRRKVTEDGIYLNNILYYNVKMKPYIGRFLILLSNGSNWEVYTADGVFICYLRKGDGTSANTRNTNWGGMKIMRIK